MKRRIEGQRQERDLQREVARDPECKNFGTGEEKLEWDLETSERTT